MIFSAIIPQPLARLPWRLIFLVAVIFACILSPSCHDGTGVVTGNVNAVAERTKEEIGALGGAMADLATTTIEGLIELLEPNPESKLERIGPTIGTKPDTGKRPRECKYQLFTEDYF